MDLRNMEFKDQNSEVKAYLEKLKEFPCSDDVRAFIFRQDNFITNYDYR